MNGARAVAAVASIGSLLQGWDSSAVAGALLYIKPEFRLEENPTLEGFVVAATLIAAVLSTISAGPSADLLGRRTVLCIAAVFLSIAGCIMLWSPNVYVLLAGRLFSGAGIGLAATVVPLLIAESVPAEIRGQLSTLPQLAGSGGQFLSYCVVFGISLTPSPNWRLMLGILSIPSIGYLLLCILFLPESPRWLVSKGRMLSARKVLQKIRNKDDVTAELALLVEGLGVGVESIEEYLLKPLDVAAPLKDGKSGVGETGIKLYGPEEGVSWIATPLPADEAAGHSFLGRSASMVPHSLNALFDPMVTLLGSIQSNIDHQLEHQPEHVEDTKFYEEWDEESLRTPLPGDYHSDDDIAGQMDENLTTPLLSRRTSGSSMFGASDNMDISVHNRSTSLLAMGSFHNRSSKRLTPSVSQTDVPSGVPHGSVSESLGSMGNIGGGWQLAWRWTGQEEGAEREGSFKRVFLFQESVEPSHPASALSLPSVGVPAEEETVQAAALIGQPALYATGDLEREQVGPAMVHPSEAVKEGFPWSNLLEPGVRRALVVGLGIQFLQQFCGINAVLYYTPEILQQSGVDKMLSQAAKLKPESCSILASATTCLLMLPCIIAAMRLIDRSGRRTMLLATLPLLGGSLVAVAIINAVLPVSLTQALISYIGLAVFTCSFVAGFGPIPNILCSEIFPTRVRGVCIGLCSATMWISNVLVTDTFPIFLVAIGIQGVFAFFAAMSIIAWFFVFLKVPETKGLPLEVISELFAIAGVDSKKREL